MPSKSEILLLISASWLFKHETHGADVAFICLMWFWYFWLKYSPSLSIRDMFLPGPRLWPGLDFWDGGLILYCRLAWGSLGSPNGLELKTILLCQSSEYRDYRCEPPCLSLSRFLHFRVLLYHTCVLRNSIKFPMCYQTDRLPGLPRSHSSVLYDFSIHLNTS